MPGLTFLNSIFLAGLAAAVVPVVIHLLHRRPARPIDFSWLEFIKTLQPSRTHRVKIQEILLLVVRVLLLACVSLALARPTLMGGLLGMGDGRARTTACIVLDGSYSMSARADGERLFDRARSRAREVISLLEPGDDAMLILVGGRPQVLVDQPIRDLDFAKRRIDAMEISAAGADVATALREASAALERLPNLNKEIYYITDSQAASWGGMSDTSVVELPGDVSLYWVTVGSLPEENIAIEKVERVETLGEISDVWVLQAVVRNLGPNPKRSVLVELQSGGQIEDQTLVDLEARSAASVLLRMEPPESGPATGVVRVAGDDVTVDDVRYFSFSGPEAVRVLVARGGAAVSREQGATRFIERALDPVGNGSSGVRVARVRAEEISSGELDAADVVVLVDVARLEQAAVELLGQFVRRGGGLFIVAGPSVDLGFYNRTLLPEFLDLALVRPEGEHEHAGFFSFQPLRQGHPVFEAFEGGAGRLLGDIHFWRVMKVEAGPRASVLAEFANVGPALVEGSEGAGKVFFFSSSVDVAWTDFPLSGGFVPFLHEAVRYLAAGTSRNDGSFPVGGTATAVLTGSGTGAVVGVDPTGEETLLEPRMVEGRPRVRWERLTHPGIHVLRWGEAEVGQFAANIVTRESDLEVLTPEDIAARIRSDRIRFIDAQMEMEPEVATLRYGRELASSFLWAALAFLALETLLIRGRRGSGSADRLRRDLLQS